MSIKVEVVPHDPNWRSAFESESKLIALALRDNVVAIHHIGSTAIPQIHA
ncbi:MAG: GrpB family protein, partial [Microcoleus sp. Co-bin12]|nr:GrpB family protein [Microcoleus sp. Co-bin12]